MISKRWVLRSVWVAASVAIIVVGAPRLWRLYVYRTHFLQLPAYTMILGIDTTDLTDAGLAPADTVDLGCMRFGSIAPATRVEHVDDRDGITVRTDRVDVFISSFGLAVDEFERIWEMADTRPRMLAGAEALFREFERDPAEASVRALRVRALSRWRTVKITEREFWAHILTIALKGSVVGRADRAEVVRGQNAVGVVCPASFTRMPSLGACVWPKGSSVLIRAIIVGPEAADVLEAGRLFVRTFELSDEEACLDPERRRAAMQAALGYDPPFVDEKGPEAPPDGAQSEPDDDASDEPGEAPVERE